MPKLLKIILYTGVFVGSFVLFNYWMLPMDAVKGRVIGAMEAVLGPDFSVHIEDIGTYWITGAKLKNLSVLHTAQGKEENVGRADQVTARLSLFSLLFGGPKVGFEAKMGKARMEGTIRNSDQGWFLDCSFKNLDVSQIPYVKQLTGLNLNSSVEGEIQINYDAKQPLKTVGKIEINFRDLQLKAGDVPLGEMGTFPLPDLMLAKGNSVFKAAIDKGAVNVDALRLKGDDFNIDLSGKIFMAPMVSRYRMNVQGKFQFSQKLWGVLDPILPGKWLEDLKKQKGTDDNFPLSVSGQFASPQIYAGSVAIYPFKPF